MTILGHFGSFDPFPQVNSSIWWAKITSGHPILVYICQNFGKKKVGTLLKIKH